MLATVRERVQREPAEALYPADIGNIFYDTLIGRGTTRSRGSVERVRRVRGGRRRHVGVLPRATPAGAMTTARSSAWTVLAAGRSWSAARTAIRGRGARPRARDRSISRSSNARRRTGSSSSRHPLDHVRLARDVQLQRRQDGLAPGCRTVCVEIPGVAMRGASAVSRCPTWAPALDRDPRATAHLLSDLRSTRH